MEYGAITDGQHHDGQPQGCDPRRTGKHPDQWCTPDILFHSREKVRRSRGFRTWRADGIESKLVSRAQTGDQEGQSRVIWNLGNIVFASGAGAAVAIDPESGSWARSDPGMLCGRK